MGQMVAIGGGELKDLETLPIDGRIVELTGKRRPRALFIPTASSDSPDYAESFRKVYGERLGCETDTLFLLGEAPVHAELAAKILSADLVYVGGGNTLKMMRRWRHLGVDDLLREAYRRGTVLSGLSAGAICWFAYGHSDSMSFYHPDQRQYVRVRCLGLVNAIFCPHLDEGDRRERFAAMMGKYSRMGIGVENNAALEIVDDQYRVITSRASAQAYRVYRRNGEVASEPVEQTMTFRPLARLLET